MFEAYYVVKQMNAKETTYLGCFEIVYIELGSDQS